MEIFHWIADTVLMVLLIIFVLDGLTFLWVRRVYQIVYHFVIKTTPHQVIMIDIDEFKSINDYYGHRFGDQLLRRVGLILLKESRLRGFRYGGEEFAVLLACTSRGKAIILAERICQEISKINIKGLPLTVSVGVGGFEEEADKALYRAKKNGKDRVEVVAIRSG